MRHYGTPAILSTDVVRAWAKGPAMRLHAAVRGGDVDLPGLGSDLLDGAHEDISDD